MAISTASPYTTAPDLVSLPEASALLKDTGHPAAPRTLKRRAVAAGVALEKRGTTYYASWSDLLLLHAEMVDSRPGR